MAKGKADKIGRERTPCERRRPRYGDYCVFNRLSSAERGVIPPNGSMRTDQIVGGGMRSS